MASDCHVERSRREASTQSQELNVDVAVVGAALRLGLGDPTTYSSRNDRERSLQLPLPHGHHGLVDRKRAVSPPPPTVWTGWLRLRLGAVGYHASSLRDVSPHPVEVVALAAWDKSRVAYCVELTSRRDGGKQQSRRRLLTGAVGVRGKRALSARSRLNSLVNS